MKRKGCPVLIQSDTKPSLTVKGQSWTRRYMLECIGEKCAAYQGGMCDKFQTNVILREEAPKMAVRPIDGNALIEWFRPYLHTGEAIPADVVIEDIRSMPTLTQPNEGGKDKNVPTNGPLTLEELRLMTEPTPVWWDWVQGWVLARKGMIISWNGVYYNFGEVKGNFYRRPPEGEEK